MTRPDEPVPTVDNLEVAQYFYMLLNSSKVRELISTTSSKVVLLLGRFTGDGKVPCSIAPSISCASSDTCRLFLTPPHLCSEISRSSF